MSDDIPTTISDLVRVADAYFKVYAKATYFRDRIKVFKPDIPYSKLLPGLEPLKKLKRGQRNPGIMSPEDIERSIRRSKKMVREYSEYNKFEILATFTFKTDRQNIPKCMAKMNTWLKNQQKRTGVFDYLIVAEFHKDGKSVHFHALIRGYKGKLIEAINHNTGHKEKHGKAQFIVSDISAYDPPAPMNGVWARATLHHLNEAEFVATLKNIVGHATENLVLGMVNRYGNFEETEEKQKYDQSLKRYFNYFDEARVENITATYGFEMLEQYIKPEGEHKFLVSFLRLQ